MLSFQFQASVPRIVAILVVILMPRPTLASENCRKLLNVVFARQQITEFLGNPVERVNFKERDGIEGKTFPTLGGGFHEVSILQKGSNQRLNQILDEVKEAGGEIRFLERRLSLYNFFYRSHTKSSVMRLTSDHFPIIDLDPHADMTTLIHEMTHLRDWQNLRSEYVKKGIPDKIARRMATKIMEEPDGFRRTEINAVSAELREQGSTIWDPNFLRRIAYPEFQGFGVAFELAGPDFTEGVTAGRPYLARALFKCLAIRRFRILELRKKLTKNGLTESERRDIEIQIQQESDPGTLRKELNFEDTVLPHEPDYATTLFHELIREHLENPMFDMMKTESPLP